MEVQDVMLVLVGIIIGGPLWLIVFSPSRRSTLDAQHGLVMSAPDGRIIARLETEDAWNSRRDTGRAG